MQSIDPDRTAASGAVMQLGIVYSILRQYFTVSVRARSISLPSDEACQPLFAPPELFPIHCISFRTLHGVLLSADPIWCKFRSCGRWHNRTVHWHGLCTLCVPHHRKGASTSSAFKQLRMP